MIIVTIGMIAILLASPLAKVLVQRLQVPGDMNVQARLLGINVGFRLIAEHPFGVGASWRVDPEKVAALDVIIELAPDFIILGSHNQYMNIAAQSGIAGLFVFLVMLFLWFKRSKTNTVYGSTLRLATSVLAIVSIFDSPFMLAQVSAMLWFLLALGEVENSYVEITSH